MARISIAAMLVLCAVNVSLAGGNGSVKIPYFIDVDNGPIDGVGVISFSNGNSLHIILKGLEPGEEYTFSANIPGLEGTIVANTGGNGNGKAENDFGSDLSDFVDRVEIRQNGVLVAYWDRLD